MGLIKKGHENSNDDEYGHDLFELYKKDMKKYPLLLDELQLSKINGLNKEELILHNLRFVVSIAKKYLGKGLPFLDLIQAGNIGLIQATDKFTPKRGNKFISYAVWWIRACIEMALIEESRNIRFPVKVVNELKKFLRKKIELIQKLEREPEEQELAEVMGVSLEKIRNYKELIGLNDSLSLNSLIDSHTEKNNSNKTYEQFLSNTSVKSPEELMMQTEESVWHVLGKILLPPDDIKKMLYLIGQRELGRNFKEICQEAGLSPLTLEQKKFYITARTTSDKLDEIGQELGITGERVRQIKVEVQKIINKPKNKEQFRQFL
ncbi:MAG: sigma-70 family RNA polymerase sigma factor [bacterium]|nr:sigma-70 family RNA polymerase sigma factor [bacterium]